MSDPSRRQAAVALDVPPDADEAAVRTAFLKKLAADGFVPPEVATVAVNLLTRSKLPLSAGASVEAARLEQADVDEFIQSFWNVTPGERREQWQRLHDNCEDPDVAATLTRLSQGLDLAVVPHADPALAELARQVREFFLLRPRERAVRRLSWLAMQTAKAHAAARVERFRNLDPKTAALDKRLLGELSSGLPDSIGVGPLSEQDRESIAAREQAKLHRIKLDPFLLPLLPDTVLESVGSRKFWYGLAFAAVAIPLGILGPSYIASSGSSSSTRPTVKDRRPTVPSAEKSSPSIPKLPRNAPMSSKRAGGSSDE